MGQKHYAVGDSGMEVGKRCACGGLMLNGECENIGKAGAQPIRLIDRKPPDNPLANFYGKIRDTAKFTDGITLAERIAVLDVVRAELVTSFQSIIDAEEL
jgi:hypothetical protein